MSQRTLPNLFIIGAMKSGTTTLHHAIGLHPEITMIECKEPRYFAGYQDIDLWWFDDHTSPDPEGRWYFDMFSQAYGNPQIRYAGESSCNYTQRPIFEGCAQRIAAFNPELTLESLRNDQGGELRKIFEWLGVDATYRIPEPIHSNKSPETMQQVRPAMLWLARFMTRRHGRKTFRQLPNIFFKVAYNLSWRRIERDAYDFEGVIEGLRPMLAEKAQDLTRLLGRNFPEWTITFPESERTAEASEVL